MEPKGFEYLEDVATADLAIKARGKDLNELFTNAARAVCEATVEPDSVDAKEKFEFHIEAKTLEDLLFDFLSEIIFKKDADLMIFSDCRIFVDGEEDAWSLHAVLHGETIDREKHKLHHDIKAVTLHMLKVEKTDDGFEATFVVDV